MLAEPIDSSKIKNSSPDSNRHSQRIDPIERSPLDHPAANNTSEVSRPSPWRDFLLVIAGIVIPIIVGLFTPIKKKVLRLWRIRYKRYVSNLMEDSKGTDNYSAVVIRQLKGEDGGNEKQKPTGEASFFEILSKMQSIHVIGKPGSGKTCALQMALQRVSRQYVNNTFSKVPIYLKYDSTISIHERIIDLLLKNDLVKKSEHIDKTWLEDELKNGKFIFFIDDVHKSFFRETNRTELQRLFEYKDNIFVIAGRDYVRRSEFGFDIFEISPLDEKRFREVISLYLASTEEIDHLSRSIYFYRNLRTLYDTPQLATFLAKVYKKHSKIPLNKSKMFQEFWKLRNDADSTTINVGTRLEILSHLAFCMVGNTEPKYIISENECLEILSSKIGALKLLGKKVADAEEELEKLLIAGFLIRTDKGIVFQHDQWQEYFAAIELCSRSSPIREFPEADSVKEVLYFAMGILGLPSSEEEKNNYEHFQDQLADYNIVIFNWCMKNFDSEDRQTLKDWVELHKDDKFSIAEMKQAYSRYIKSYQSLSVRHFPTISKQFYPDPHLNVGAIVAILEHDVVHQYGLRQIGKDSEEVVILTKEDVENIRKTIPHFHGYDYFFDNGVRSYSSGSAPILYNSSLLEASKTIFGNIKDLIQGGRLIETFEMQQERIYFESRALDVKMGFSENGLDGITYGRVLNCLRKRRIANFITPKHVQNNQLNNDTFMTELRELFDGGFDPPKTEGSTTYGGIYDHNINDEEFGVIVEGFVKNHSVNLGDTIKSPLPIFERKLRFKIKTSDYTVGEWNDMVGKSIRYYEKLYSIYKEVVELNFPTIKNSFETFRDFPMRIFVVENYERKIASVHLFGGISTQKEALKITALNDPDEQKLKSMISQYKHHSFRPFGLFSRNLFENEPLRRGVYELIKKEYQQVYRF